MRLVIEAAVIAAVVALSLRRGLFLWAALLRSRSLPAPRERPTVTVLVPARNERGVAERLLAALARLEYPSGKLSFVLVCDGCEDHTPTVFRVWANERSNVRVLELPQRAGKAAALNAGLQLAEGEIIAVVDADLAPQPDFLLELVRPFTDDRVVASAGYLRPANADQNNVTRFAAVTSWVHQLVTSAGADRLALSPPTLGAAAFRRTALRQIGGFPIVSVGEDVATSATLIREGGRTRFVVTAVADNIVVSGVRDYLRQHVRWSRSVFGTRRPGARRSTGLEGATATWAQRLELGVSSIGYGDRLVFAVAGAGALVGAVPLWVPLLYLAVPGLEIVAALLKVGLRRRLPAFLLATVVVFGLDLVGSVAAVVLHVARRPYRWHSPRTRPLDEDAIR